MFRCKVLIAVLCCLAMAATSRADDALRREAESLFGRIVAPVSLPPAHEVALGQALFWDVAVSSDGKTACATCHPASAWGADAVRFSRDAQGKLTSRNTPTIFNTMIQPSLRWLGDRADGAAQAEASLVGSMGFASKDAGLATLRALGYEAGFRAAYPSDPVPLSAANYGRALAAYQATLVTPARFDRFLAGDDAALSAPERAGLRAFIDAGCAACHNGALLGGTEYKKFGVVSDYWRATGSATPDVGRFSLTKQEEDRYVFRVPMLRNVSKTAPYFHDGSVGSLPRAVQIMAEIQLGATLDAATTAAIVRFLDSLTGDVPANYRRP